MKIYKDKDGYITIVYAKGEEPKGVCLVQDRGTENIGCKNMWGNTIERYLYHCANVSGNTSYSSTTNKLPLKETSVSYNLIKSKRQPPKKKALGPANG